MSDTGRVKSDAALVRPDGWAALVLAILTPFAILGAAINMDAGGLIGFLVWAEVALLAWVVMSFKPYLTVWKWQREGEYEQRNWSPEERGLERGRILVYLYRTTNAESHRLVPLDSLKQFGGWTFAELYNLLAPLADTDIIDLFLDDEVNRAIAFTQAEVRLTPAGILATEDAVSLARQRPGYSVTIQGNDNQVQVATVNSEQLRNT